MEKSFYMKEALKEAYKAYNKKRNTYWSDCS